MSESHDDRSPATRLSAVIRTEIEYWLTTGYADVLSINDGSCEEFAEEVLLHPDCPKAPGIRIYETFDLRRVEFAVFDKDVNNPSLNGGAW